MSRCICTPGNVPSVQCVACFWPDPSPTYQCTRVGCNDVAVQGGLCAMHDKKEGR